MPNNEWGDFQTPAGLVAAIIDKFRGEAWSRVLEPTCGVGTFMESAQSLAPAEIVGVDVNQAYAKLAGRFGRVIVSNVFEYDFRRLPWWTQGPLLVIGNPPWVTNAQLSEFGSINLPAKSNLRGLKGLDALTGASNFDIAEYIWLKLIIELAQERPTIALLSKTHVARNVLSYCHQFGLPIAHARLWEVDAKKWFGAAVDACLFSVTVGAEQPDYRCELFSSLDEAAPRRIFGFVGSRLVADMVAYERSKQADGICPIEWRQGVKHDASAVMELLPAGLDLINKAGDSVTVESEYLFPLAKSTDLFKGNMNTGRRVLVPQRTLGAETKHLATTAPRLWQYLLRNEEVFVRRKSSIYVGKPRFSIFGVGDYTFAPYKVAISGLHKEPRFRLLGPIDGKPVILDDTCYFLPFDEPISAALAFSLLTSAESLALVSTLAFVDAKRPITKKLLQRVDLSALARLVSRDAVASTADRALAELGVDGCVNRWTVEALGRSEEGPDAFPLLD